MSSKNTFIGDLSKKTGVPVKTIRYYEDLGLLRKPQRTFSAYRLYTEQDVEKLLFVKRSKELGLTLAEIKEILDLSVKGLKPTCSFVRQVFSNKIKEYECKIQELMRTKAKLEARLKNWVDPNVSKEVKYSICPQIEARKIASRYKRQSEVKHGKN